MSRMSKVPERYLATAKRQAIREIKLGNVHDAISDFFDKLESHPYFVDHPSFDKTTSLYEAMDKPVNDADEFERKIFIEHIKNDF